MKTKLFRSITALAMAALALQGPVARANSCHSGSGVGFAIAMGTLAALTIASSRAETYVSVPVYSQPVAYPQPVVYQPQVAYPQPQVVYQQPVVYAQPQLVYPQPQLVYPQPTVIYSQPAVYPVHYYHGHARPYGDSRYHGPHGRRH